MSSVALVGLVLVALYEGYAYRTAANPQPIQLYAGIIAGVAVLILVFRMLRRRH